MTAQSVTAVTIARIAGTRGPTGFTLIELLVTMAILAILVSIAYPLYLDQMRKTRRAEAVSNLLIMANLQERFFQNRFFYHSNIASIGYVAPSGAQYTFSIANASTTTFTVQALARSGTPQFRDTQCRTMTLSATGARQARDTSNNDTTTLCWRQ